MHFYRSPLVTEESAFHYLQYTAYRKYRAKAPQGAHLIADVHATQSMFADGRSLEEIRTANPNWKTIGISQYGKIIAAVKDLAKQQYRRENVNRLFDSSRIREISQLITQSKPVIDRATFKNRPSAEIEAYSIVDHLPRIEEAMWTRSTASNSPKRMMTGLRNRYFLNSTVQEIKRGEAVGKNRLCDLVFVSFKKPDEPSRYEVLCSIIDDGKTNKGTDIQLSKAMRHMHPERCSQGGLAFYLLVRFKLTKEDELFDFSDNKSWFNAALLVGEDVTMETNEKPVGNTSFISAIEAIFRELGLPNIFHKVHFGRTSGPAVLELAGVAQDQTKLLGNWSADVFNKVYSQKLPLEALRVAAGFPKAEGLHYNARAEFTVPYEQEVFRLFFPHLERQRAAVHRTRHPTADHFLKVLSHFRRVIAQDAAYFIVKGRDHHLFNHPLFPESNTSCATSTTCETI